MKLSQASQFKKDIKRQKKRGKDIGKIKAVIELLLGGKPLPTVHRHDLFCHPSLPRHPIVASPACPPVCGSPATFLWSDGVDAAAAFSNQFLTWASYGPNGSPVYCGCSKHGNQQTHHQ